MSKKLKTVLWAALLLGVLILIARGMKNNPEWRAFSWAQFTDNLLHVQISWLLVALLVTLLSYLLRALRWREFLFPVKKTSVGTLLSAVVIGFAAVSLLGRAGELTRPIVLSRKGRLPFSVSVTVIIMERIFDSSVILILFLASLAWFRLGSGISVSHRIEFQVFTRVAAVVLTVLLAMVAVLFVFQANAVRWIDFIIERMRVIPQGFKQKLEAALKSFVDGLTFIRHPRPLINSLAYSFVLWLTVASGSYFVIRSFHIPFTYTEALVLLAFSAVGAVVQLPGVGGGYQALTLFALVSFLGINPVAASAITLLAWAIAFFPVVGIGVADLLRGGMSFRDLKQDAERELKTTMIEGPGAAS
ncbi:MAG: lysylphosphatidylglycerol synthase transmembrane domain-containing protein [Acidobacteriia bacterium]|nr:lysylphosphatidylglycerol synthase transmembrane domain-containing protein [Terriglobia bacterium]